MSDAPASTDLRDELAWMLWCVSEGYLLDEDRAILTNWISVDGSQLHPDDIETRAGLREAADAILASGLLDRIRAEAWDEGTEAVSDFGRVVVTNPYRAEGGV